MGKLIGTPCQGVPISLPMSMKNVASCRYIESSNLATSHVCIMNLSTCIRCGRQVDLCADPGRCVQAVSNLSDAFHYVLSSSVTSQIVS